MSISNKLKQRIKLTEYEISELIFEYEIYREEITSSRWTQQIYSLVLYDNHIYEIYWDKGLTEYQDDNYYDQPQEITEDYHKRRSYYIELVDRLNDILLRSDIITQREREDIIKSFKNQNKKYFIKF